MANSPGTAWELLPMTFGRLGDGRVLLTNLVGETMLVAPEDLESVVQADPPDRLVSELRAKHMIRHSNDLAAIELLALKVRTRYEHLPTLTRLHIFVVTLRCEHSCHYCQVSRKSTARDEFDMTRETALAALDMAFSGPAPDIKIEFQGGEPLLNLPLIEFILNEATEIARQRSKGVSFVIATNLALLSDAFLDLCRRFDMHVSTSLDGPEDLHNAIRKRPGGDSWRLAVDGIRRVQEELGPSRVSALMTTTEASFDRAAEIVDTYVELGLRQIFLRPLSPYGFAVRGPAAMAYDLERWVSFYEAGLKRIIEHNAAGRPIVEFFAATVAKKLRRNDDPGYVDLMSPAGIGLGALVYNYDGGIYASDEGRMLAEMGDERFRLGELGQSTFADVILSDPLLDALESSFTLSSPMCSDCAFEPFCGADPVYHYATTGDFLGRKAESEFCRRNMSLIESLIVRAADDQSFDRLLDIWAER